MKLNPLSVSVSLGLALTGCYNLDGQFTKIEVQHQEDAPGSPNSPDSPDEPNDPGNTVCNPFGEGETVSRTQGLHGRLFYLPESAPRYSSVGDYLANGIDPGLNLFFNQLYTPTRPFDRGFVAQDGSVLKAPDGSTLYEHFALQLKSNLKLGANDAEGRYQLALLSDDGSVLRADLDDAAGSQVVVNNDIVTPTRMACASFTINLNASSRIPIEVDYFQGPRYHIALVALWRKIDDGAGTDALADPACGRAGNDLYFDSTRNPPAPLPEFQGLIDRGWRVIAPENFELPGAVRQNPCAGGPVGT